MAASCHSVPWQPSVEPPGTQTVVPLDGQPQMTSSNSADNNVIVGSTDPFLSVVEMASPS